MSLIIYSFFYKKTCDFNDKPLILQSNQDGLVAEWLGRGLQNLVQRFESARDLQKVKASHLDM